MHNTYRRKFLSSDDVTLVTETIFTNTLGIRRNQFILAYIGSFIHFQLLVKQQQYSLYVWNVLDNKCTHAENITLIFGLLHSQAASVC